MLGFITANAVLAVMFAAWLVLVPHAWWQGVMWLINVWGNGGIAVALTRNYKDGLYG